MELRKMTIHLRAMLLLCLAICLSQPAQARNAVVVVIMAGEAYDGAPKFNLIADDRIVGSGEVSSSIDTAKGKKLNLDKREAHEKSQRFSFDVPDIDSISRLDIEFVNDARAKGGKPGDRNLYVLSISLSTVRKNPADSIVTIHQFLPPALEAVKTSDGGAEIGPRYAALYREGRLRLNRPAGGWEAALQVPATPEAEAAPAQKPAQKCKIPPLELVRFEKNASALSQPMREQLARLKNPLANMSCTATVTAFTGGGPSQGFRDSLSQARLQAVAKELSGMGMAADKIVTESAKGGGRRVVIRFR